ncbi:uncharacterized protein TRIVIDRAFT_223464 [Trichoderma virens Gv29-8]|uniref:Uncharacterized protein n=1 Tax=Hypocrea virens (strain Gv29-8 / FGSC 10586) TaxID=413071 RepID=G9MX65_HYPVG|nr:uncharacterized protein TRIVIDRAFT_223464 [Trichoderma virens Gv29-8]EHK20998.1 hypothetical protein TRIVIDRAFT_223464 [Trichoderma virens Gv29-8]UKZ52308.1 hypothetical protein TrVGV298_006083 [Trichoderma virens]
MDLSGRGDPSPMPHAEDDDIQDLIESLISSYKFGIPESSERNGPSPPPEPVTERQAEDVHSNIEPINTPPSIAELRQQCVLAFETCVHYESLMNHQWAENRFADFNLSVEGVGALSESGASPDSCFESGQDDMALVQNALTMLKNFLAECISCAKERSSTDAATEKVDSSLEKLALIVAAIRKTGMRSRLARDGRFKLKEHEELAAFLRVICLRRNTSNKFGIEVGKEDRKDVFKFERLSTQEIIKISEEVQLSKAQQRLIEVNLRRRNRFLQAQEHSKNLKACQNGKQEIVGNTRVELDRGTQRLPNMKPLSPENPERNSTRGLAQRQIQPTPTAAETKAPTAEGSFQVRRAKRTASQPAMTVMSAITAITALTAAAQYPKAPDVCQKSTMFKCPCCCQTLPAKFGTDKDLWKYRS